MLKKFICCFILCSVLFPSLHHASGESKEIVRAAFIRNDQLWIKIGDKEKKVTHGEFVRFPKWSSDGKSLAYLKGEKEEETSNNEGELWVYNIHQDKHVKVSSKVKSNFQWSPNKNIIGFQSKSNKKFFGLKSHDNLFVADVKGSSIQKVDTEISNFSWLPNGDGFLVSSKKGDHIDSNIDLYKITLNQLQKEKKTLLYTIQVPKDKYFTSTSKFKWSQDKQWIAFMLVPTPSMSADSNALCILSQDGKDFYTISEMLNYEEWFNWSPNESYLSQISGESREAIKNKKLKVFYPTDLTSKEYTPNGYVDRGLTWIDERNIITSRSLESEWGELNQRPLPKLYKVNIFTNNQTKFTSPSIEYGDFYPQFWNGRIIWVRTDRKQASIWIANSDGTNYKQWIPSIDLGTSYYEKWNWKEVFSLYLN